MTQLKRAVQDGKSQHQHNEGVLVLDEAHGFLFILITDGQAAMFYLRGGSHAVGQVYTSGNWSTTKDNAGTFNVYWDSTDSRYELQNKSGAARTIGLFGFTVDT